MKAIDISQKYFFEYTLPLIKREFPSLVDRVAAGLAGEGSECLGLDDGISKDHDIEPACSIWLTDGDYERYSLPLHRALSDLPREYMGLEKQTSTPVGGARRGVMKSSDFYIRHLGTPYAPKEISHFLSLPSHALLAASNGKVFYDPLGEFTAVREELKKGYPRDVQLKKLSAKLLLMAQSGLYNFPRCKKRGDKGAFCLSLFEFVKNTISAVYLINNAYEPFYKWSLRMMEDLPALSSLKDPLTAILANADGASLKALEDITRKVCLEASKAAETEHIPDPEALAYLVNDKISDNNLRNEHILYAN